MVSFSSPLALKLSHFVCVLHRAQHGERVSRAKIRAESNANVAFFCLFELKQAATQKEIRRRVRTQDRSCFSNPFEVFVFKVNAVPKDAALPKQAE